MIGKYKRETMVKSSIFARQQDLETMYCSSIDIQGVISHVLECDIMPVVLNGIVFIHHVQPTVKYMWRVQRRKVEEALKSIQPIISLETPYQIRILTFSQFSVID